MTKDKVDMLLHNQALPKLDRFLLDTARLRILSTLPTTQWCRLATLSKSASIHHGYCSRQVASLVKNGYAETTKHRRQLLVKITELGRARLAAHASALRAIIVDAGALDESADATDTIPEACLARPFIPTTRQAGAALPPEHLIPPTAEQLDRFARIMGEELRAVRQGLGWTRKDLKEKLVANHHLSLQALATYEQGIRQAPLIRIVEVCMALGVHPDAVLGRACRRAFSGPACTDIDLRVLASTDDPRLRPVRRWAMMKTDSGQRNMPLPAATLDYLAQLCDITAPELVDALHNLRPT